MKYENDFSPEQTRVFHELLASIEASESILQAKLAVSIYANQVAKLGGPDWRLRRMSLDEIARTCPPPVVEKVQ